MQAWLGRAGGALGTGLMWAGVWAAVGALVGAATPRAMEQVWLGPPIGLSPGLLAGLLFSVALAMTAGRLGFHAVSLTLAVVWGGLAGASVGALPFVINEPPNGVALWQVAIVVIGSMAFLGAASGAGSVALARALRAGAAKADSSNRSGRSA